MMRKTFCAAMAALALFASAIAGLEAEAPATFRLDSVDGLAVAGAKAEVATYRGRKAVRLVPIPVQDGADSTMLATLKTSSFKDGVIEAEIAGFPRQGAPPDSRGFVGIAFRVQPD